MNATLERDSRHWSAAETVLAISPGRGAVEPSFARQGAEENACESWLLMGQT
jgi:hypothetical protein